MQTKIKELDNDCYVCIHKAKQHNEYPCSDCTRGFLDHFKKEPEK